MLTKAINRSYEAITHLKRLLGFFACFALLSSPVAGQQLLQRELSRPVFHVSAWPDSLLEMLADTIAARTGQVDTEGRDQNLAQNMWTSAMQRGRESEPVYGGTIGQLNLLLLDLLPHLPAQPNEVGPAKLATLLRKANESWLDQLSAVSGAYTLLRHPELLQDLGTSIDLDSLSSAVEFLSCDSLATALDRSVPADSLSQRLRRAWRYRIDCLTSPRWDEQLKFVARQVATAKQGVVENLAEAKRLGDFDIESALEASIPTIVEPAAPPESPFIVIRQIPDSLAQEPDRFVVAFEAMRPLGDSMSSVIDMGIELEARRSNGRLVPRKRDRQDGFWLSEDEDEIIDALRKLGLPPIPIGNRDLVDVYIGSDTLHPDSLSLGIWVPIDLGFECVGVDLILEDHDAQIKIGDLESRALISVAQALSESLQGSRIQTGIAITESLQAKVHERTVILEGRIKLRLFPEVAWIARATLTRAGVRWNAQLPTGALDKIRTRLESETRKLLAQSISRNSLQSLPVRVEHARLSSQAHELTGTLIVGPAENGVGEMEIGFIISEGGLSLDSDVLQQFALELGRAKVNEAGRRFSDDLIQSLRDEQITLFGLRSSVAEAKRVGSETRLTVEISAPGHTGTVSGIALRDITVNSEGKPTSMDLSFSSARIEGVDLQQLIGDALGIDRDKITLAQQVAELEGVRVGIYLQTPIAHEPLHVGSVLLTEDSVVFEEGRIEDTITRQLADLDIPDFGPLEQFTYDKERSTGIEEIWLDGIVDMNVIEVPVGVRVFPDFKIDDSAAASILGESIGNRLDLAGVAIKVDSVLGDPLRVLASASLPPMLGISDISVEGITISKDGIDMPNTVEVNIPSPRIDIAPPVVVVNPKVRLGLDAKSIGIGGDVTVASAGADEVVYVRSILEADWRDDLELHQEGVLVLADQAIAETKGYLNVGDAYFRMNGELLAFREVLRGEALVIVDAKAMQLLIEAGVRLVGIDLGANTRLFLDLREKLIEASSKVDIALGEARLALATDPGFRDPRLGGGLGLNLGEIPIANAELNLRLTEARVDLEAFGEIGVSIFTPQIEQMTKDYVLSILLGLLHFDLDALIEAFLSGEIEMTIAPPGSGGGGFVAGGSSSTEASSNGHKDEGEPDGRNERGKAQSTTTPSHDANSPPSDVGGYEPGSTRWIFTNVGADRVELRYQNNQWNYTHHFLLSQRSASALRSGLYLGAFEHDSKEYTGRCIHGFAWDGRRPWFLTLDLSTSALKAVPGFVSDHIVELEGALKTLSWGDQDELLKALRDRSHRFTSSEVKLLSDIAAAAIKGNTITPGRFRFDVGDGNQARAYRYQLDERVHIVLRDGPSTQVQSNSAVGRALMRSESLASWIAASLFRGDKLHLLSERDNRFLLARTTQDGRRGIVRFSDNVLTEETTLIFPNNRLGATALSGSSLRFGRPHFDQEPELADWLYELTSSADSIRIGHAEELVNNRGTSTRRIRAALARQSNGMNLFISQYCPGGGQLQNSILTSIHNHLSNISTEDDIRPLEDLVFLSYEEYTDLGLGSPMGYLLDEVDLEECTSLQ